MPPVGEDTGVTKPVGDMDEYVPVDPDVMDELSSR